MLQRILSFGSFVLVGVCMHAYNNLSEKDRGTIYNGEELEWGRKSK
jgi:hypothetical protein